MRNDFIQHSAKGTTWEKTKHKYIERKLVNGKWVYRYAANSPGANGSDFHLGKGLSLYTTNFRKSQSDVAKTIGDYREAEYQGRKAAYENYERQNSDTAEYDYKHSHPIEYYQSKGEAAINRLLKKK